MYLSTSLTNLVKKQIQSYGYYRFGFRYNLFWHWIFCLLFFFVNNIFIYSQEIVGARSASIDINNNPVKKRVDYFQSKAKRLQYIDYEFARNYLKEAYLLSLENRTIEMQKLLKLSTEYRGKELSDYWYLLSIAHEERWQKSRFDWLNKAFAIDQWFETPPVKAAKELVRILYKWDMYDEIIALTRKWQLEITQDKDIQFYLALAYNNSGNKKQAIELALSNLEKYNYEERYFRILLDTPNISKEMWVNFHFYLESYPPKSPDLLRYLISQSTDSAYTEDLLSVYTGLFGDDYFTTAQHILLRQDNLISRSDIFFNNYPTSDFLILSQVIHNVSGVRSIEDSLRELNGVYIMDKNYDGIPEEELTFINGDLTERHLFPSKPNENDITVRWNIHGEPASYHSFYNHNGNSRTIELIYSRYPFIHAITITDYDSRRVYNFSPGQLSYSISNKVPLNTFDWAISPLQTANLSESNIMRNSRNTRLYETQYRQSDWTLRAQYDINHLGELKQIQIDRDLDGTFDEISHFENNQRNRTIRDENQDGNFELVISYQNGIPQKYQVDIDNDGHPDFSEILGDVSNKIWHTLGGVELPHSSYKYETNKIDYIYSYYFKWSNESLSIFTPEYLGK